MTTKTLGAYLRNLFGSLIKRKQEYMKLKGFLSLIQDEEARIELEIDDEEDYQYHHFWLSDFRSNINVAKQYRDYYVSSFSFEPEEEVHADIRIYCTKCNKKDI